MDLPKSSDLRAVAIVPCRSLSEAEYYNFIKDNDRIFDNIIFSTQQEASWSTEGITGVSSIVSFPYQTGISAARNRGIESISSSRTIFFFPNLSSRFVPDYVAHVLKLFSADSSIGAISGDYLFKGQTRNSYATGPLQGHSLFLAYEPTIAISGEALKSHALKFDEDLGTGNSKSKRWSGGGAELIFRLSRCGFKVIYLNKTASHDYRKSASHSISIDYKYGRGYLHVTRLISGNPHAIYRALMTLNKLLPTKIIQTNRSFKPLNALAFILGVWSELLSTQNRMPKS